MQVGKERRLEVCYCLEFATVGAVSVFPVITGDTVRLYVLIWGGSQGNSEGGSQVPRD